MLYYCLDCVSILYMVATRTIITANGRRRFFKWRWCTAGQVTIISSRTATTCASASCCPTFRVACSFRCEGRRKQQAAKTTGIHRIIFCSMFANFKLLRCHVLVVCGTSTRISCKRKEGSNKEEKATSRPIVEKQQVEKKREEVKRSVVLYKIKKIVKHFLTKSFC